MILHRIEEEIVNFIGSSEQNFIGFNKVQIYDNFLIGIADASDSLWKDFKSPDIMGPNYSTPNEWLTGAKSVISYFLQFSNHISSSNKSKGPPSQEWLYGRYDGEIFNNDLRELIVELIESAGGKAMAPALDKRFEVVNHLSNWSERHAAFIAGLGTFSLNHSLITNLGTAGRFGSVITDMEFEAITRPYQEYDEYCTKCGICIERCPVQAVTEDDMDKEGCSLYLLGVLELNKPRYGCGKCQTSVPCEHKNPKKVDQNRSELNYQ